MPDLDLSSIMTEHAFDRASNLRPGGCSRNPGYVTPSDRCLTYELAAALADERARDAQPSIDVEHLEHQREWSRATFGPDPRTLGVLDHLREELDEVEAAPHDVEEWADVLILAFDGAWRAGHEPAEIIAAVKAKQARNEQRTWPDWRTQSTDHKIKALPTEEPKTA